MPVTWTPWRLAAWTANAPQPQPTSSRRSPSCSASFVQTSSSLVVLRLLERLGAARPDRARVGHRRVEEQREEVVGDVVVVRDRALVAADRVAPALRAAARRRACAGRCLSAPARTRGGHQPRLGLRVDRRRRVAVEQREHLVDVVDLERAGHVGAAQPELARARAACGRARRGERTENTGPSSGRRRAARSRPTARSGTGAPAAPRPAPSRSGAVLKPRSAYFVAWRSGEIRTTSQARPSFSSAADHPGRRVDLPAAQAVRGRGRERVVVVVPCLAHREAARATAGCATRPSWRSGGGRRSGRAS